MHFAQNIVFEATFEMGSSLPDRETISWSCKTIQENPLSPPREISSMTNILFRDISKPVSRRILHMHYG